MSRPMLCIAIDTDLQARSGDELLARIGHYSVGRLMAKIPAFQAGDRGSIPRRRKQITYIYEIRLWFYMIIDIC